MLLIKFLYFRQYSTLGDANTQHIDCQIGNTIADCSIGNYCRRDAIKDNVLITLAQSLDHLIESLTHEELYRIWRYRTCYHDIKAFIATAFNDTLIKFCLSCKIT